MQLRNFGINAATTFARRLHNKVQRVWMLIFFFFRKYSCRYIVIIDIRRPTTMRLNVGGNRFFAQPIQWGAHVRENHSAAAQDGHVNEIRGLLRYGDDIIALVRYDASQVLVQGNFFSHNVKHLLFSLEKHRLFFKKK